MGRHYSPTFVTGLRRAAQKAWQGEHPLASAWAFIVSTNVVVFLELVFLLSSCAFRSASSSPSSGVLPVRMLFHLPHGRFVLVPQIGKGLDSRLEGR